MGSPKRIGFVDYQLENFHANVYLKALRTELKERGFTVAGCWGEDLEVGQEWASKNDVPYFSDIKDLNEAVDCFMILAPSNPERHLHLAEQVLPFGKATYIDKTFAPDLATAKKIFALADANNTVIQTTSALRYTNVQRYADEKSRDSIQHMITWGNGRSFEEYGIHPTELLVSCMGADAKRAMWRGTGDHKQIIVDYSEGRTAIINSYSNTATPFSASVTTDEETKFFTAEGSLFVDAAAGILDFLESGKPNIDRAESLLIRYLLDLADNEDVYEKFIDIEGF